MSEYDPHDVTMPPADEVDIEAPQPDVVEQHQPVTPASSGEVRMDVEEPAADVFEQHQPVVPAEDDEAWDRPLPTEADPADAIEQRRVVALDEDEDR